MDVTVRFDAPLAQCRAAHGLVLGVLAVALSACAGQADTVQTGQAGSGGSETTGGATGTGGRLGTGGTAVAGATGTGGHATGVAGTGSGGSSDTGTGGAAVSGAGGAPIGTGGTGMGGAVATGAGGSPAGTGGTGVTGTGGTFPFHPPFILGADISWTLEDEANQGATYSDGTGVKPIEEIMADNGFNFVRLRTFVQPSASDGYAPGSANNPKAPGYGTADGGWCSTAATVKMAQRVKKCGLGVFLDFHMRDTWASLGSQGTPSSWVGLSQTPESTPVSASTHQNNIFQAAHDYVAGVMQAMVAGGVKPDMVQIGNETNSGMSGIDMSNWPAFAALVNAGIKAVRETDPAIIVWAQNGRPRDANFGTWVDDYLSDKSPHVPSIDESGICGSTYGTTTTPAGDDWKQWFGYVISTYDKPVLSCEYTDKSPDAPAGGLINGIMRGFPNHMGYGSFIWEPTRYPNLNSNTLFNCGAGTSGSCATPWKFTTNAAMAQYPILAKSYGLPVPSGTCQP